MAERSFINGALPLPLVMSQTIQLENNENHEFMTEGIKAHYIRNWGDVFNVLHLDRGPMLKVGEEFSILEFPPRKERGFWTYATCGLSVLAPDVRIELHLFSGGRDESIVELLTAVAHYHISSSHKLDLWHTVNFGRPWQHNSKCSFGLISLPYLDGPLLEDMLNEKEIRVKFYWLIPITESEKGFKQDHGIEALEHLFEGKV
jgi:hypothetical protein